MDNVEKALEIAHCNICDCDSSACDECISNEKYNGAMEMAKWKDNEFKNKILSTLGCNECIEHRCVECKYGNIKEELLKGLLYENVC